MSRPMSSLISAVADGDLADGIDRPLGIVTLTVQSPSGTLTAKRPEGVGLFHAVLVGIRPVGNGNPHAFLRTRRCRGS